jgi:DNA invertase Pin-like site-specific DNA recombinase
MTYATIKQREIKVNRSAANILIFATMSSAAASPTPLRQARLGAPALNRGITRVRELKAQGMRPVDIAKALKIGQASVYRVLGQAST